MITHWIKLNDGSEYPVVLSQVVVLELAKHEGISRLKAAALFNDFVDWPIDREMRLYYFMFKNGARKNNREFPMLEEDFIYWLDEHPEIMEQLNTAFMESQPEKKTPARQRAGK